MNRFLSVLVSLTATIALAAEEPNPRTDLYGDPLPPGAVMRYGTIRLRHCGADVTFSKDGKQLISCGTDGTVRFWDSATGKLLRQQRLAWMPRSPYERLARMALSPEGVIAAAWNGQMVYVYDVNTGAERGRVRVSVALNYSLEPLLKFSPDGKLLVLQVLEADKPRSTQIWDIAAFQKRRTLGGSNRELDAVSFTRDGKRLLGRDGGKLFLWDVHSGEEIDTGKQLCVPRARGLAFTPDGKTAAVGSLEDGGRTRFLDAANLKERGGTNGSAAIKDICDDRLVFSSDGRFLAGSSKSDRGRIFIWDRTGKKETQRLPGWNVFAFSPKGQTLVYGLHEFGKQLCLWDAALGCPILERPGQDQAVAALATSSDGRFVVSDAEDGVYLWDAARGKSLRKWQGRSNRHSCLLSPDGKRLIRFAGVDTIQILDLASGKEMRRFNLDAAFDEREPCQVLGLSADGKRLTVVVILGETSAKLYVWDLVAGKELRRVPYKLQERITSLSRGRRELRGFAHAALSPDAEVVSVWREGRVGLEEVASGRLLAMLPAGVGWPLVFSPDGQLVAAAILQPKPDPAKGEDRKGVALIEAATGEELFRLEIDAFDRLAFTPDGRGLVVADGKYLRVWDTNSGERLHRIRWPDGLRDSFWREVRTCSLIALPGGRAVTGLSEGEIVVWDLSPETWPSRPLSRDLDRKQLDALWIDLAGEARTARSAVHRLTAAPAQSLAMLDRRVQPAAHIEAKRIDKLLVDLDNDDFVVRESATRTLAELSDRIEPMLRRALQDRPSLEMRRRLESILAYVNRPSAERLRTLRAIVVLEGIGTAEARRILEKLSDGVDARETRAAKAALVRLQHRSPAETGRTSP